MNQVDHRSKFTVYLENSRLPALAYLENLFFIIHFLTSFKILREMINDVDKCKCSYNGYRNNRREPYYMTPLQCPSLLIPPGN
jgi:hypothetical protein